MAISVESRKRLWGLSGGKCAICKEDLFFRALDYDTVIGAEAHIIARSPGGPRREALAPETRIDDYINLILLCPRDHKIIDLRYSSRVRAPSRCSVWYQAAVQAWRPEHLSEALAAQAGTERPAPS